MMIKRRTDELVEVIRDRLNEAGIAPKSLTISDLVMLDGMHVGGWDFTRRLAEAAEMDKDCLVLDAGCGIGGSTRLLTSRYQWRTVGLDISEGYCRVARVLSEWVGLDGTCCFLNGNASRLPFADECFDGILSQHSTMNIAEKGRLFEEYHRVLKPGGKLMLQEITAGIEAPVFYPVPWAEEATDSHLVSAERLWSLLSAAGFSVRDPLDVTGIAEDWFQCPRPSDRSKAPLLNQRLIFGEVVVEMVRNMRRNLAEDRIRVVEAVLCKAFFI